MLNTRSNTSWFCKFNNAREFPGLFVKENKGLDLLRRQNLIRVPDTVACTQVDAAQILFLQWIGQGIRSVAFWRRFGEQLARLHRVTPQPSASTTLSFVSLGYLRNILHTIQRF